MLFKKALFVFAADFYQKFESILSQMENKRQAGKTRENPNNRFSLLYYNSIFYSLKTGKVRLLGLLING